MYQRFVEDKHQQKKDDGRHRADEQVTELAQNFVHTVTGYAIRGMAGAGSFTHMNMRRIQD
jgi:hypothetical protein